ncbi:hypothetical protein [Alicyclobacillus acidocaldarius]|uniref:Uncharacterized protein n=1 Tax=Alicyclobacillus acidocaldarius (strain Tc-4-1) TaxID=1048834 RepID=F8II69_ALIAT|nr:hypothetical protein [Alicyclobacillus acidocaldarius]AEJ44549.1 hypothetical protein TC41_2654 [Alicyclobacillus acidocaldarius subsp. acidocaldarius Tc-4-1]
MVRAVRDVHVHLKRGASRMARWVRWVAAGLFDVAAVDVVWFTYAEPRHANLAPVMSERHAVAELPIERISFRSAAAPYGAVHHLSLPGCQVWSIDGHVLCVVQYPCSRWPWESGRCGAWRQYRSIRSIRPPLRDWCASAFHQAR